MENTFFISKFLFYCRKMEGIKRPKEKTKMNEKRKTKDEKTHKKQR